MCTLEVQESEDTPLVWKCQCNIPRGESAGGESVLVHSQSHQFKYMHHK